MINRRDMVLGAGAAITACCVATPGSARAPAAGRHGAGLIDVHHHILAPGASATMQRLMAGWTPARAVEDMDRTGMATGIAYPGPILTGTPAEKATRARAINEYAATLGRDHPGRFGLFASLPFPEIAETLMEIDHALDHLHADGFGLATSYGDAWLGDPSFSPIWEKMNDRAAVIFVHPADAACCAMTRMGYGQDVMDGSWIEWPMNTARTILSLMSSGTLRRYPRIRFIFAHGGGVMPLLVRRIAGFADWPSVGPDGLGRFFPEGVERAFASLHFECAQAYAATNIGALRSLVPDTQLLFGSDYPIFPMTHATGDFARATLPPATRRAIARGNAETLLPRWAEHRLAA